jgi:hypothetical protein
MALNGPGGQQCWLQHRGATACRPTSLGAAGVEVAAKAEGDWAAAAGAAEPAVEGERVDLVAGADS